MSERDEERVPEDVSDQIAELQNAAREAGDVKTRREIFQQLEELTGGGIETRTIEGNTRWIRTRVDYD